MLRLPDPGDLSRDELVWTPGGHRASRCSTHRPRRSCRSRRPCGHQLPALRRGRLRLAPPGGPARFAMADRPTPPRPGARRLRGDDRRRGLAAVGYLLAFAASPWLAALGPAARQATRRDDSGLLTGRDRARFLLALAAVLSSSWPILPARRLCGWTLLSQRAAGLGRLAPCWAWASRCPSGVVHPEPGPLVQPGRDGVTGARFNLGWGRLQLPARRAGPLAGGDARPGVLSERPGATRLRLLQRRPVAGSPPARRLRPSPAQTLLGIPEPFYSPGVWASGRDRPALSFALARLQTVGFYLLLAVISPARELRLPDPGDPLAGRCAPPGLPFRARGGLSAGTAWHRHFAALLLGIPLVFATASFAKNDLHDRLPLRGSAAETGLLTPGFRQRNVPEVRAAVAAALRSPGGRGRGGRPGRGWGSSYVMGLDLPFRTLPLSTFSAPLGARYLDAAELAAPPLTLLTASRVVLVVDQASSMAGSHASRPASPRPGRGRRHLSSTCRCAPVIYWSDLRPGRNFSEELNFRQASPNLPTR